MTEKELRQFFRESLRTPSILTFRCARIGIELYKILLPDWPEKLTKLIEEKEREEAFKCFTTINNAVRYPQGWRKEVYRKLFSYTLKPLKWKPSKKPTIDDIGHFLGLIHGMTKVGEYQARAIIAEEKEEEFIFKGQEEFLQELSDLISESSEPIWLNTSVEIQMKLGMKEENRFSIAFQKASRSLFKDENTFTRERKITRIYFLLLIFEKEIRRLPTVEDIYDFIRLGSGDEFDYDLDSFRVMCSRIKLSGNKWGSSMI